LHDEKIPRPVASKAAIILFLIQEIFSIEFVKAALLQKLYKYCLEIFRLWDLTI
jgi:hypothetical protein